MVTLYWGWSIVQSTKASLVDGVERGMSGEEDVNNRVE